MQKTQKNSYGIPYIELANLDDIRYGKFHYNYNEIDFMFNFKDNSDKLIIIFHGAIRVTDKLPMFLKHDYDKDNISALIISDKLLELSKTNIHMFSRSGGFCETNTIKYHTIYKAIIQQCIDCVNKNNNHKIIFIGPCIGAKPALYFGSFFAGIVLILNGWIYLSDDVINFFEKSANLEYGSIINYDIEQQLIKSPPKCIYIYINKSDNDLFAMTHKFIIFCKNNIPNNFSATIFDYYDKTKFNAHMTFFPEGETFDSIIQKI